MIRQGVILVGGRGTRLGALAADLPKPLVSIAGSTRFLDYLIADLARHGINDIVLLAGHLAQVVEQNYQGATVGSARVRVVAEPEPAGTAGALRHVAGLLDETFLLANGDSLFDTNYLALDAALGATDVGAIALRRVQDAARYGRVVVEGERITGFHEKDATFQGSALISAGVYLLRRRVLDLISQSPCSIEQDVFPKLAAEGKLVGVESAGDFIDIGLPETLKEARADLPTRMRRGAVFFDRDGTLIHDDGYTYRPEALKWQPGAIEAVRACNDTGRLAIVVTNQSGVARGLYSEDDMRRFHAHMQVALAEHGAHIDAFYHCPHHGDGIVPAFTHANHPDRKPNPGMLRRATLEWPINAARSFLVGDTESDMEAARTLGMDAVCVATGEILNAVKARLEIQTLPAPRADTQAQLKRAAVGARTWLFEHALPLWWERGFDRNAGCFYERLALDGTAVVLPRRIRVQARQTAVYAMAGRIGWQGPWRAATEAGARVLLERGLRADGGTRHLLDSAGAPLDDRRDLYDLAFVVFALAQAAQSLGNRPDLIAAAENLVQWADTNWAHPEDGFREGDITPTPPRRQNPHMHMFEALLALHDATGNAAHLERANVIADLFRAKLFDHGHSALPEYYDDAWRPLPGEDGEICEPGHQFEWSWLLHHADKRGGRGGRGGGDIAEKLRIHGEIYGVELGSDAVYDEVFLDGRARKTTSRLWPHTERLKANLARFELTRDPEAARAALAAFDMIMRYCDVPTRGLWHDRRLPDGSFVDEAAPASSFYHVMLAMAELIRVADMPE